MKMVPYVLGTCVRCRHEVYGRLLSRRKESVAGKWLHKEGGTVVGRLGAVHTVSNFSYVRDLLSLLPETGLKIKPMNYCKER
jgi:hypothetical protein